MKLAILLLVGMPGALFAQTAPIYSYSVPQQGGYDPSGNVMNYTDSVTGTWSMSYDGLSRLQSATATAGPYSSAVISWQYDSFGNRLNQNLVGTPSSTVPTPWATYDGSNRMSTNQLAPAAGVMHMTPQAI